jgi:hypothetical protein
MSKKKQDLVFENYYQPHLNRRNNSPVQNQQSMTERMYMRILTELATNRFKWVGLPDTIDARFLELTLFYNALAVFYWDRDFDRYLVLRASGAGPTNFYDNPTSFTVTGGAMINKTLGPKNCVPIWSNYLRTPDLDIVLVYSKKLANIDRTIEIASDNMRQNKLVTTTEDQRLSWVNILRQMMEGQPVIFGTRQLQMEELNVFDLAPHPETLPNLQVAKTKIWNECMTYLGINNANQEKRERLVADEVSANDQQIAATRAINMNAREQACEQINRMYKGLDVSVQFNLDANVLSQGITALPDDGLV